MPAWAWVVLAVIVVGVYVLWLGARLDRLHARVDAARAALDAQLVRRASVTLEIAATGLLDPATSLLLAGAAHAARDAGADDREVRESDVTRALLAAFPPRDASGGNADADTDPDADADAVAALRARPDGRDLLDELDSTAAKVQLARRFHADAVQATKAVRRRVVVRLLRLAGHAPEPAYFEMDDTPVDVADEVR